MPALSNSDLESMREELEAILPDTCHVLSVTRVSDGQGGFTETWGTATANIACRIDPYRGSGQVTGEQIAEYHTFVATLPYGTTVTTAHRLEVDSVTYSITSVASGRSWPLDVRAWLEKI